MSKLGTYTTIDCPPNENSAENFLRKEFNRIDGVVRKVMNPHDFGAYPSFEIDLPSEYENIDEDNIPKGFDKWIYKANDIEQRYYEKFF